MSTTARSSKLTLVANPKTRKDWENNKAYYQEKFFSDKQKQVLREKKRKEEAALSEIGKRQEYSTHGTLAYRSGCMSKHAEKEAWKHHLESYKIYYETYHKPQVTTDTTTEEQTIQEQEEQTIVNNEDDNDKYININPTVVVDSWEELC